MPAGRYTVTTVKDGRCQTEPVEDIIPDWSISLYFTDAVACA